ncbi:relaxase/mobilization nuclease domain-containing protein [Flavitalea sp. BT771]|uniref:relaxase/mobilization nuclease domain-containing protein n=1 Tax=Flavitalea sp. BT771 TaxID=3063329 RepID=UPI0026E14795|nr:relaxase/mobilization nuclease domain-containing protein [Flavitalea sp. BT771]MDO6433053.1 relaxase/mobilization nuclease domain-containing protein [Flavitalea sp. BT771]MDV6221671.1 relaxase/mobilization nuclease domain-containing protein [Flavitalea sp. BT771]
MLAKIKATKFIRAALNYNEKKQALAKAQCIAAGNFVKDVDELTFEDKLYHFRRLTSLNENVAHNGLHISINFHPEDKLSDKDLVQIATTYMERMKLGHQPYLVYRHSDVAHPHAHILTTTIQKDGTHLNQYLNYVRSKSITKELDQSWHLVQSQEKHTEKKTLRQALKVKYGETATMPALSNVLDKVLPHYEYTSLEELNAVLRLYNVEAYRGKEQSHLYQHRGMIYWVLDEDGRRTSTYIKASLFNSKPTLDKLEKKFELNLAEAQRQQHRQRVTANLEWNLARKNMDLPSLQKALEKERITMVWMESKEGKKQNIFYVDHETRAVFDGNKLGERYDATALHERLAPTAMQEEKQALNHRQRHHHTIMHDL